MTRWHQLEPTDADVFDINRDRSEAQNLGFGYGIHSCLGAALARMESRIALDRLLDFMPDYEVDYPGLRRTAMTSVNVRKSRAPIVTGRHFANFGERNVSFRSRAPFLHHDPDSAEA